MSDRTPLFEAWLAHALAVESGDPEAIEYTYRAFEQVVHAPDKPKPLVVMYSDVPQTVEAFAMPLINRLVNQHISELREAFCITLSLSDSPIPTLWDDMGALFAEWLLEQLQEIDRSIPDKTKRAWEREREEDEDEDSLYDWSDQTDEDEDEDESEKE